MSDTIRQKICSDRITRLKAIEKSGGYSIDYLSIEEWKLTPDMPEELPAITLRDDSCEVVTYDRDHAMWRLHLTVIITARGDESQEDLRNYVNDIYVCIGSDKTCGGYGEIIPEGDEMVLQQEDNVYGDIEIKFHVLFETRAWDLTKQ